MPKTNKKQIEDNIPFIKPSANRVLLQWSSPEYTTYERGKLWYVIALIILASIIVYSLYSNSWTTAVVFILLAGVYFMHIKHTPREIGNAITELGIQSGLQFYPFGKIKGFWIVYNPPKVQVLHILLIGKKDDISIELNGQSPAIIRNLLSKEIPELEGKGEPFINYLQRIFKL